MSKMGISTYQSYCGAQIFDAVGLKSGFVGEFFFGTATRIEGVGLEQIAEESARRHRAAFGEVPVLKHALDVGGEYLFRTRGEAHAWSPETVATLQHAVRGNSRDKYRAYAQMLNEQSERMLTFRGMFRIKSAEEDGRKPVPLDEVEPAKEIVRRFSTGAMSFGSISREAHTTLAIAMNRIGGKSNTGEGGEEADRFKPLPNGDSMRSAIKQVASGRFGVTTEYLVNSDVMQIKMAQGAKPGEGGQLPGHKVDATIAKVRHSTPGVGLISPPPHHDIYSIEDLAQLIYDLKNTNPAADRGGLRDDARLPSQHLPGRRRDAGPGAAQAIRRAARARHQLLLLRRRGSARDHGRAWLSDLRRNGRSDADARQARAGRALEAEGPRLFGAVHQARRAGERRHLSQRTAEPSPRTRPRPPPDRAGATDHRSG